MEKQELIQYWLHAAELDIASMDNFIRMRENTWALFIGHLIIEKTLKALYVQNVGTQVPHTHNLIQLASVSGLEITDDLYDKLDTISTFNISTRYPDDKFAFYKQATSEFVSIQTKIIKDIYQWLLSQIKTK
jgi:HEPN domain-containing protein